jgi:hypothetical protein
VETDDIASELQLLAEQYLHPKPKVVARQHLKPKVGLGTVDGATRSAGIHRRVQDAFRNSDISHAFRWNIRVDEFVPGDPLVIDCGYEARGTFKMFHGLALKRSTNGAKNLAFSYPWFSEAFAAKENLKPHLVAVLDDEGAPKTHIDFANRAFLGTGIQGVSVGALGQQVEFARAELT